MSQKGSSRGHFGIGAYRLKYDTNFGTLLRTAKVMGADYVFTINKRCRGQNSSVGHENHIPQFHFDTVEDFEAAMPEDAKIVGIEQSNHSRKLERFNHPNQAVYLLGAEDYGLVDEAKEVVDVEVEIPATNCLNVSVAGSVAIYDRILKESVNFETPSYMEKADLDTLFAEDI